MALPWRPEESKAQSLKLRTERTGPTLTAQLVVTTHYTYLPYLVRARKQQGVYVDAVSRQETVNPKRTQHAVVAVNQPISSTMPSERDYQIHPIVPESVLHNTKSLSNLNSLTASLLGVSAGILGLESYSGFLFYLLFSIITASLFYVIKVAPESTSEGRQLFDTGRYFRGAFDFWTSGIFSGLSGFILTWTLFYGLVRA
ncbi:ER membrane protein complex subunit [Paramyrothecium foliicola]|nr:ER membrane protein complex subunit [Paramyrothecium foliicola]